MCDFFLVFSSCRRACGLYLKVDQCLQASGSIGIGILSLKCIFVLVWCELVFFSSLLLSWVLFFKLMIFCLVHVVPIEKKWVLCVLSPRFYDLWGFHGYFSLPCFFICASLCMYVLTDFLSGPDSWLKVILTFGSHFLSMGFSREFYNALSTLTYLSAHN